MDRYAEFNPFAVALIRDFAWKVQPFTNHPAHIARTLIDHMGDAAKNIRWGSVAIPSAAFKFAFLMTEISRDNIDFVFDRYHESYCSTHRLPPCTDSVVLDLRANRPLIAYNEAVFHAYLAAQAAVIPTLYRQITTARVEVAKDR